LRADEALEGGFASFSARELHEEDGQDRFLFQKGDRGVFVLALHLRLVPGRKDKEKEE